MAATVIAVVRQSARYQSVSVGLLRSARSMWLGITLVSVFVGLFVLLWGLGLPAFRGVALLSLPFFGLALVAGRVALSVGSRPAPAG